LSIQGEGAESDHSGPPRTSGRHNRGAPIVNAALVDEVQQPVTGDIALLAVELPDLHGDPADRFILVTAITHDATLVTDDARMLQWRSEVKRHNAAS
jgi:hypothetical protein